MSTGDARLSPGDRLTIVVNPSAGSDDGDAATQEIRAGLPDAEIVVVRDDLPLEAALDHAGSAAALGIVGGDGSINAAAQRALATRRPLAVLPGGTLNHF